MTAADSTDIGLLVVKTAAAEWTIQVRRRIGWRRRRHPLVRLDENFATAGGRRKQWRLSGDLRGPEDQSMHFRNHQVRRGGLDQHGVGAGASRARQFRSSCFTGHHENRHRRRRPVSPKNFTQGNAVDQRQAQFRNDHPRRALQGEHKRFASIAGFGDVPPGQRERFPIQLTIIGVAVDHEDSW